MGGEDCKGGLCHLAGKNGLEEASNVRQIGSGIADIVGFAFPPAAAVGALLGVASSVAEGFGKREEQEDTEAKIKKKAKATTDKHKSAGDPLGPMLTKPAPPPPSTVSAFTSLSVCA